MIRRTTKQSGFTIIEVVITIAIGAAVMALVLNAVAGARRSQRNNARSSDVNQIAAGINQYIAVRNELPSEWDDIQQIIDPAKFGHYDKATGNTNASINATNSWGIVPVSTETTEFITVYSSGTAPSGPAFLATTTIAAVCSDPTFLTASACTTASETWTPASTGTAATPTTDGLGSNDTDAADLVVVFKRAGCADTKTVEAGGIREMAIAYRLEGQSEISCLEI